MLMVVRGIYLHYNKIMFRKIFALLSVILIMLPFFYNKSFAATSSNCIETAIGNPPANAPGGCASSGSVSTGNQIGDYAMKLQGAIQTACNAYHATFPSASYVIVSDTTKACLNNIPTSTIPDNIIQVLRDSIKNSNSPTFPAGCQGLLQCVGFAQAVALATGQELGTGNARDFGSNRTGYSWHAESSENMRAGDFPVWESHIAVAIETSTSPKSNLPKGYFKVAEANGCGEGSVGVETYPAAVSGGANYSLTYDGFLRRDPTIK